MKNRCISFLVLLGCVFSFAPSYSYSEITEEEAHDIAVSAYLYFYPLVTMDVTRKQMTNVEAGKIPGFGPMNRFNNLKEYPAADMRTVVRPNFDTLYSISWLDLTQGPLIVSVPNTDGRYYLLPMLDMWTDVFASPGWRTTGTEAMQFLVYPRGWSQSLPEGMLKIEAPTPYVWIIGRTKTDGPNDYDAVHKIQEGFKITSLEGKEVVWNKTDPQVDMKTAPKTQVEAMPASQFFSYAAELLKLHLPHLTDEPILALLRKVGFERGKNFDLNVAPLQVKQGFEKGAKDALALMQWKIPTLGTNVNGWSMNTSTMGVYGNDYLKRAIIAAQGLGANLPEDAIYPLNLYDKEGKPLNGQKRYVLHFEKNTLPPVEAFWSITLYDENGYQVPNALNRFALSSWMPFKYNADGSLDLYFQNESPGKDKESNWLPAPKDAFNLTMRLYAPKSSALVGKWNPPPVEPVK